MRGDWCVVSQYSPEHCAPYFPVPDQVISYHYVRKGRVFVEIPGTEPDHCGEGSMILFPRNDSHLIGTGHGLEPTDIDDYITPGSGGAFNSIEYGEGTSETSLFCGWLGVSSGNHPLLDSLPAMMIVDGDRDRTGSWMSDSMRYAAHELQTNPLLVAKLSEVFFARAVRSYVKNADSCVRGWLAALRDPAVARALAVIHNRFAEDLEVDAIAREAGVSRTVLAERFVNLLGDPPMRYCSRWRMRQAANMLRDGNCNNASIAHAVGFSSEAAFARAFKREFDQPPSTWKRRSMQEMKAAGLRSPRL
jgi:AraC-like DNA-binding protein